MNQIFEVIIVKKKVNFIATCPIFPDCKGIAKTREEALNNLANSISTTIYKSIKESLTSILSSDNYTQLLVDHSNSDPKEQIAFNLNFKNNIPRSFMLKVASFSNEEDEADDDDYVDEYDISLHAKNIDATSYNLHNEMLDKLMQEEDSSLSFNPQVSNDSESFVFGFPLNFN